MDTVNSSLTSILNALVPLQQISDICKQVFIPFAICGAFLLVIGYLMAMHRDETGQGALLRMIMLMCAMAASPWLLNITQDIVTGLVNAVGDLTGSPEVTAADGVAMNWAQPYAKLGQLVSGTFPDTSSSQGGWWEISKTASYVEQQILIFITEAFVGVTIVIMHFVLIIQKLIILFSGPLIPLVIGSLSIPAAQGSSQNILKHIIGVLSWPIGWAIVSIGWVAALNLLKGPGWGQNPGSVVWALIPLFFCCGWMILGAIGAPLFISASITHGTNAVQGLVSAMTLKSGAQASGGLASAGAGIGLAMHGQGGARVGGTLGNAAGLPFRAMSQSMGGQASGGATNQSRAAANAILASINTNRKK